MNKEQVTVHLFVQCILIFSYSECCERSKEIIDIILIVKVLLISGHVYSLDYVISNEFSSLKVCT